jgi:hypothetical protein
MKVTKDPLKSQRVSVVFRGYLGHFEIKRNRVKEAKESLGSQRGGVIAEEY